MKKFIAYTLIGVSVSIVGIASAFADPSAEYDVTTTDLPWLFNVVQVATMPSNYWNTIQTILNTVWNWTTLKRNRQVWIG